MKRTKIVCTLGPASREPAVLETMIRAGMDVARLNFSHGTHEEHAEASRTVRQVASSLGREVAILQDLQGPKIRVGVLKGGPVELHRGERVVLQAGEEPAEEGVIPTTYESLHHDVRPGDPVLMDDGLLRLRVEEVQGKRIVCRILEGGTLKGHKGINLPGVALSTPALTQKDREDLAFGARLGVDFVSLSFVRKPEDVLEARAFQEQASHVVPIIAKIEKPEGVARLSDILDVAEGIMIARGDLGVELGPEKVPLFQKKAIEMANLRGKLVITATQMLESMIHHSTPTRAEASDVANAVLDQTDAVMLSGETAMGSYPVQAIETMVRIIEEVESSERYRAAAVLPPVVMGVASNAVAHAAAVAFNHVHAGAIVCISRYGNQPRLVSDYRPQIPIIALVGCEQVCRILSAYWGVIPLCFTEALTAEETITRAEALLLERGLVKKGDNIILTMGVSLGAEEHTNTLKIHTVG